MPASQSVAECRPEGRVCWCWEWIHAGRRDRWRLARLECRPIGQTALGYWPVGGDSGTDELAGRSYSATLVAAVAELADEAWSEADGSGRDCGREWAGELYRGARGAERGEGTGRARPDSGGCGVAARGAGGEGRACRRAALDAHRHEVFLRLAELGRRRAGVAGGSARSWRRSILRRPRVAVCDESAAALLESAWPGMLNWYGARRRRRRMRFAAVRAGDCWPAEFADLALLDGHYLRRSDAEIFGDPSTAKARHA